MALYPWTTEKPIEWKIANFKGIKHANIPLPGVTVLCGSNSSGKSSIIQTLLLVAQNLTGVAERAREISLNGELVRLGSPQDVVRDSQDSMVLSWMFNPEGSNESMNCEMWLTPRDSAGNAKKETLSIDSLRVSRGDVELFYATAARISAGTLTDVDPERVWGQSLLRIKIINNRKAPNKTFIAFQGLEPRWIISKVDRPRLKQQISDAILSGNSASRRGSGVLGYYFGNPASIRTPRGTISQDVRDLEQSSAAIRRMRQSNEERPNITRAVDLISQKFVDSVSRDTYVGVSVDASLAFFGDSAVEWFFPHVDFRGISEALLAFESLSTLASSIRYLGPLREEPKVLSALGQASLALPVGAKGQYTADLLARSSDSELVSYTSPTGQEKKSPLIDAVDEWAEYLDIGSNLSIRDEGKLGRGLQVKVHGVIRDLTNVGVGVSQALPILVMCLSAEPGSTLIFEQPELHLHPAVQSRMGEFFATARTDISLLVETHSEYMVTRLRTVSIRRRKGKESRVNFVFSSSEGDGFVAKALEKTRAGDVAVWPEGFFDTQEYEQRLLIKVLRENREAMRSVGGIQ